MVTYIVQSTTSDELRRGGRSQVIDRQRRQFFRCIYGVGQATSADRRTLRMCDNYPQVPTKFRAPVGQFLVTKSRKGTPGADHAGFESRPMLEFINWRSENRSLTAGLVSCMYAFSSCRFMGFYSECAALRLRFRPVQLSYLTLRLPVAPDYDSGCCRCNRLLSRSWYRPISSP